MNALGVCVFVAEPNSTALFRENLLVLVTKVDLKHFELISVFNSGTHHNFTLLRMEAALVLIEVRKSFQVRQR